MDASLNALQPPCFESLGTDETLVFWGVSERIDSGGPALCTLCANLDLSYFPRGKIRLQLREIKASTLETRCRGCELLLFAVEPYVHLAEVGEESALLVIVGESQYRSHTLICWLATYGKKVLANVEISTPTPTSE
jgi:hypothetical protein